MFASIVYVLAFLAHLTEWVLVRSPPCRADGPRSPVAASAAESSAGARAPAAAGTPDDSAEPELRVEMCGRIGVALTVVGCAAALRRPGLARARLATRSGCPGATCTSSRSPAPSASA